MAEQRAARRAGGRRMSRREAADTITVALARELAPADVVAVGIATPLALVAALLARAADAGVHVIVGGAVDPAADAERCQGGPSGLLGTTPGWVSMLDTLDMIERQAVTVEFLRPAQVDAGARLNLSRIGPPGAPRVRFPGGLGCADVPRLLPRVVAYLPDHRPRSLPARVDCVTGTGTPWRDGRRHGEGCATLVTDLAVIRFTPAGPVLARLRPDVTVADVLARTGFPLRVPADVGVMAGPDRGQRRALARVDPGLRRAAEVKEGA